MKRFKSFLYPLFFFGVLVFSCGLIIGAFFLYHFLMERYGEILVIIATLLTFIWLANLLENSRRYQKIKEWFFK